MTYPAELREVVFKLLFSNSSWNPANEEFLRNNLLRASYLIFRYSYFAVNSASIKLD